MPTQPWMRVAAACLMFLVGAAPCAAEWRRIDSPNFVVVGDVGARRLRDIAVEFEGFRETLSRVLAANVTSTAVPTVVVVFPSDRAFTPVKTKYQGKAIELGGMFMSGRDFNHIAVVADGRPERLRVVFHEYAHLIVANVLRNPPTWLNEGLAEYYSAYEVSRGGREAVLGAPIAWHLMELNMRSLLPVEELVKVDASSPLYNEGDRRSMFYAQSWALMHMILMGEPRRTEELSTYLRGLEAGDPSGKAWTQAFGAVNMDQALRNYVRRQSFTATRFTFPDKLSSFDAAPAPVTPAEAQTYLAELLIAQGRHDEAAGMLKTASSLDPGNMRVKVVGALLDSSRQDYAAAERLAEDIGANDWLTAYGAGVALASLVEGRGGQDPGGSHVASARRLLESMPRERSELANVLARLATLDLVAPDGPSPMARTRIERARLLAPGRDDYAFAHASILARLSQFPAARSVLGPFLSPVNPPEVRQTARSLMGFVLQLEQGQKSAEQAQKSADVPNPPQTSAPAVASLRPVFRETAAGEQRLEGLLERIECTKGGSAVFHLQTADGPVRTQAPTMDGVDFITYREDLSGSVACGPLETPLRVYLTWRAGATPDQKVVVAIEFLPKEAGR